MSTLSIPILVLDKNFQVCGPRSARDIIPLMCVDKAKVLDRDFQLHDMENWIIYSELYIKETGDLDNVFVKSPSIRLLVPEVIVLLDYLRNPNKHKKVRFSRGNIFKRDNYVCQYCGKKVKKADLTMDHIVPKSQGGPTTWTNITSSCFKCNTKKANKSLKESGMRLLSIPIQPTWKNQMESLRGKNPLWEKLL